MANVEVKTRLKDLMTSSSERHSLVDDVQGLAAGSMMASLGVLLLSSAGLLTGGTTGVA
ncbi:MAG: YitT family protein, partial [Rhizobium sp.]|nr:YitT family protein [Rhizobium sp.]